MDPRKTRSTETPSGEKNHVPGEKGMIAIDKTRSSKYVYISKQSLWTVPGVWKKEFLGPEGSRRREKGKWA